MDTNVTKVMETSENGEVGCFVFNLGSVESGTKVMFHLVNILGRNVLYLLAQHHPCLVQL